jgi:hypothetical protein
MNKSICLLLVLATTACGGRNGARGNAAQQQYETVQEGSAVGVTSTIQGPGETLPPITGTNEDTTTDFALNPNATPASISQQQASTYPPLQTLPPMTSASSSPVARPVPMPSPASQAPQTQPTQPAAAQPNPTPAPVPTATTETTAPEPPPATTTTAPEEKPKDEEPPPPPADDTSGDQAEEPPPPPPSVS